MNERGGNKQESPVIQMDDIKCVTATIQQIVKMKTISP